MALTFVTDQIKDNAVTAAKIAASTITSSQMAMNGSFAFTGALTSSATPSSGNDVANKTYVDGIAQGLHWKESCDIATTANITLSGTQTIDGVAIVADDRVLVKDQSTGSQNGIYVCAAGAWSRATDLDAAAEFPGAAVFVREGSANADSGWVCTNDAVTVGTTAVVFAQFTGAGQITAGDGLAKSGNTLSVSVDDSSIEINSDALRVKASGITNAMLGGSIANGKLANSAVTVTAGDGLSGGGSVALGASVSLAVGVDDSSIETNSDVLRIKASGVTNAMLAGSIADSKLAQITTSDKVAGSAVELAATTAIEDSSGLRLKSATAGAGLAISSQVLSVGVDDSSIEINSDALRVKASGITNAMLGGSIADSKLSTISTAGKVALSALDIDGGTDIGAAITASDLIIVDDGAGGTNRKCAVSRLGTFMAGNGLAVSSGVLAVGVDDSTIEINSDAIRLKDAGTTFAKLSFQPRKEEATGDGSTTAFNLTSRVVSADWYDGVILARNGQMCRQVPSNPSGISQYTVTDNGSTTTLTFGTAPLSGDVLMIQYFA